MDPNQVLLAATSLIASVVGSSAVLWAQHAQSVRERRASAAGQQAAAIEEVLVRAQSVDLKTHQIMVTVQSVASLNGLLTQLLRPIAPVNVWTMYESLNDELAELNRAAAHIWMSAPPDTVALAHDVVVAAADVLEAHILRRHPSRVVDWLTRTFLGPRLGDPVVIEAARVRLHTAREALVVHVRSTTQVKQLHVSDGT